MWCIFNTLWWWNLNRDYDLMRDYATETFTYMKHHSKKTNKRKSYSIITQNYFTLKSPFTNMICSSPTFTNIEMSFVKKERKQPKVPQLLRFLFYVRYSTVTNPNDIQKKFTFSLYSPTQQKNLGNFCKLYPRDNWFDWNETKIWGNIEKWERAKVRSVDKQQIDWNDHTLYS